MNSKEALERLVGKTSILNDTCASLEDCIKCGKCRYNEPCETCDDYNLVMTIKKDLDRLEKLEKFKKLCLTKYVPLDCLSPSFWESEKEWLELMSYDYYLYLCEDVCEYVVKDNQKLTPKEFKLIYDLLKEVQNDVKLFK